VRFVQSVTGPAAALVVDGLAVARLTRLVVLDTITDPIRDRIIEAAYRRRDGGFEPLDALETWTERAVDDNDPPKLATLVTCTWCTGVWVAAGAVVASRVAPRAWRTVATTAALAWCGGRLAEP
jgi:hypothetical protein